MDWAFKKQSIKNESSYISPAPFFLTVKEKLLLFRLFNFEKIINIIQFYFWLLLQILDHIEMK